MNWLYVLLDWHRSPMDPRGQRQRLLSAPTEAHRPPFRHFTLSQACPLHSSTTAMTKTQHAFTKTLHWKYSDINDETIIINHVAVDYSDVQDTILKIVSSSWKYQIISCILRYLSEASYLRIFNISFNSIDHCNILSSRDFYKLLSESINWLIDWCAIDQCLEYQKLIISQKQLCWW